MTEVRAAELPRVRPSGPVTTATRVARASYPKPVTALLKGWPVLPAAALAVPAVSGSPHIGAYASQVLGGDATLCLVCCLSVSPVVSLAPVRIAALRRWYGLWVAALGTAGLAIAVTAPGPGGYAWRAAGTSVNWTGLLAVVLLLPLAAISNQAAMKLLGPEWKRWQRAGVWTVWALIIAHLIALRSWMLAPALIVSLPLVVLRRPGFRRRIRDWRAGGYDSGGMWLALDVLAVLFLAGTVALIAEEAAAVARAVTLAPVH